MGRRSSLLLTALMVVIATPGCGTDDRVCGPVVRDALDPGSGVHVLPGAPTPSYLVDPPTSGAHQPGPSITGPLREPVDPQVQVGLLEQGRVVVQYLDLGEAEVQQLEALNSAEVLVAPATSLPGDTRVAATAWTVHQHCSGVDTAALDDFVDRFAGTGPGGH